MKRIFGVNHWLVIALLGFPLTSLSTEYISSNGFPLLTQIETDKTSIVIGEPSYITVRLSNSGSEPIAVPGMLEWQSTTLRLMITAPDGRAIPYSSLFFADLSIPERSLAAGEQIEQVLPIFFGAGGWSFQQPGTYKLKLSFNQNSRIGATAHQSNQLSIVVTEEVGASALLVNDSKSSAEAGKFLFWQQGDHLKGGIENLNRLVEHYPDSILANYSRFALARNLSRSFRNYTIGELRKADCQGALELFRHVQRSLLPANLAKKMDQDQSRCSL